MRRIAVLGNSIAAVKAVEEIKKSGEEVEAAFFSAEQSYPYDRRRLDEILLKEVNHSKILYRPIDFYEKGNYPFVFEKKVSRINIKKNRIFFEEDKNSFEYDSLLISDLDAKPLSFVKGSQKSGIYNFKKLFDVQVFLKSLPLLDTVVIVSDGVSGVKTAAALCDQQREVILIISGTRLLPSLLTEEISAQVEGILEQAGVRLVKENAIVEFLGDSDLKAIRLKSGKVIGCQAVLTDEIEKDLRPFKDTDLDLSANVKEDFPFRTNILNIFVLDRVLPAVGAGVDWDYAQEAIGCLENQGRAVAAAILGQDAVFSWPNLGWDIRINDIVITVQGLSKNNIGILQPQDASL